MTIDTVGPLSSGVAAGGAGVATANTTHTVHIDGHVLGVYLKYNDSPPNTTDVIITAIQSNGSPLPDFIILEHDNENTDGLHMIGAKVYDRLAGTAVTGAYANVPVDHGKVNIKIDQANAGDSVEVYILIDRTL